MKDHSWQLTSFELSKKLKELGVKQESLWWWKKCSISDTILVCINNYDYYEQKAIREGLFLDPTYISAFTVAELDKRLYEILGGFITDSDGVQTIDRNCEIKADTGANARAMMLICLKERGDKQC